MKPDCYKCKYRKDLVGDTHSTCTVPNANIVGDSYGIQKGWFFWPFNFDPTWLKKCDGFKTL